MTKRKKLYIYNYVDMDYDECTKNSIGEGIDNLIQHCIGMTQKEVAEQYLTLNMMYDDGRAECIIRLRPWLDGRVLEAATATRKDPLIEIKPAHIKDLMIQFEEFSASPETDLRDKQRRGKVQRLFLYKSQPIHVSIDPMRDLGLNNAEKKIAKKGVVNI